ncbi:hypothetical protein ACA910_020915 [Epithemia clementina (nom. ined.)]
MDSVVLNHTLLTLMNQTVKEHVEQDRTHFRTEYDPIFEVISPRLDEFFAKKQREESMTATSPPAVLQSFPAVDIGSGHAVGTVTMALRLRSPHLKNGELIWYPSDWTGHRELEGEQYRGGPLETETKASLRYHIDECQEFEQPLFTDPNGEPIYRQTMVELRRLNTAEMNGRRGVVRRPDPLAENRFAVQLSPIPGDCKSLHKNSIFYVGEVTRHEATLRELRKTREDRAFFQGLLDRTREIDVLKHETWSNDTLITDLYGRCALVTCINLLTCLGYRDPTAWKDTLELASRLLVGGGYLVQYDAGGYADFGVADVMQAFSNKNSLGLQLEVSMIPPNSHHGDKKRMIVVWQKVSSDSSKKRPSDT